LLNANKVEVEINGFCYAREIGCEEIFVKRAPLTPWSFLHKLITPFLGPKRELDKLTTEVLEGTIINISNTNAKVVRGHDVRLGPGCDIGEVEYSGKLEVDAQAIVGKQTKII
jgi:cytoskeletal protein CcmA (bactofilin family)